MLENVLVLVLLVCRAKRLKYVLGDTEHNLAVVGVGTEGDLVRADLGRHLKVSSRSRKEYPH